MFSFIALLTTRSVKPKTSLGSYMIPENSAEKLKIGKDGLQVSFDVLRESLLNYQKVVRAAKRVFL